MSKERIITWGRNKRRPSAINATKTVAAFFAGKQIETDADRIYIAYSKEHWIEVVMEEGQILVVTRSVNQETSSRAEALSWTLASAHGGEYKPNDIDVSDVDDCFDDWDEDHWI
jgi:hypothetical protein